MENQSSLDSSRFIDGSSIAQGNESFVTDFNDTFNDSRAKISMKRSISRASFRQSFRSSKSKLDEFFKSPLDFGLKRKRSRREDDCISLAASEDFSLDEPKNKRRSSLAKVTSLAALLSPVAPAKKVGHALQKSLSSWTLKSVGTSKAGQYRDPIPTPPRRRASTFWHETVSADQLRLLSKSEIDRQEAIYEVLKSEEDLIEDMNMMKRTYQNSMIKLQLMTDAELNQLFGHLSKLIPLHQELVEELRKLRDENGFIEFAGSTLSQWIPKLDCYVAYCANQVYSKALLDSKRNDSYIKDFLERCQESPFSRHLDLWSFLDVPRSRLVKYPLLIRTILKYTPAGHEDMITLNTALASVERIINEVDHATGLSKCEFMKNRLAFNKELQKCAELEGSKMILCEGHLRTRSSTKLYACLFDKVLILTRPTTIEGIIQYQLYKTPLSAAQLIVEDSAVTQQPPADQPAAAHCDSTVERSNSSNNGKAVVRSSSNSSSTGGSFKRSKFQSGSSNSTGNSTFRVSLCCHGNDDSPLSIILQANDELDKQHWLRCLDNAVSLATSNSLVEVTSSSSSQNILDTTITARPPKLVRRSLVRSRVLLSKKRRSFVREPDQNSEVYELSSDISQIDSSLSIDSAQESLQNSEISQQICSIDKSQLIKEKANTISSLSCVADKSATPITGNFIENFTGQHEARKLYSGNSVTEAGKLCNGNITTDAGKFHSGNTFSAMGGEGEKFDGGGMGEKSVIGRGAFTNVDGIRIGRKFQPDDEIDVDECADMFRDDDIISLNDDVISHNNNAVSGSVAISRECEYIDGSIDEELEFDL